MTSTRAAAKPATCKYKVGQAVQVLAYDFTTPGFPQVWVIGQVVEVKAEARGIWHVNVQTGPTSWQPQLVGPRGGNPRIRAFTIEPNTIEIGECDHCGGAHLNADH